MQRQATAKFFSAAGKHMRKKRARLKNFCINTDHLGNTRVSFQDADQNGAIDPENEVIETNDYYPFGLEHGKAGTVIGSTNLGQQYKFNGVELNEDLGLNLYEMDFRQYDPALGRFTTTDALSEKRYWVSNYNFAQNNPILRVDPSGLLDDYGLDQYGKISLLKKTDDDTDTLYAVNTNENGEQVIDKSKGSVTVSKDAKGDSVISDLSTKNSKKIVQSTGEDTTREITVNTAETSSQSEAFDVFKFAADNSNVEWSLHKSSNSDSVSNYTLGTYHLSDLSPGFNSQGGTRLWLGGIHSHPNQNTQTARNASLYGDAYTVKDYFGKYGENKPYYIYFPSTGGSVRLSNPKESYLKSSQIIKKSFKSINRF